MSGPGNTDNTVSKPEKSAEERTVCEVQADSDYDTSVVRYSSGLRGPPAKGLGRVKPPREFESLPHRHSL